MEHSSAFQIWIEERVLVVQIAGAWSLETAKAFSRELKHYSQPLIDAGQPWAHLALLEEWQSGTSDIEPEIQRLSNWMVLNGLSCTANVFSPDALKSFQLSRMLEHLSVASTRYAFDNEKSARRWLASRGFLHCD
ncbi:hypothetical protein HMF8227_00158 [Saliniradius amylolyticus]|uniref:STAS/SEC14 domain-containing protein n=1 Tax=Saliniradius amylolyticus TaxID=2183582 RepID=A0A2S2DZ59_9ALTE|nr:hypothetical protein HMF8227_00158 [Saliniradius amylolyticus]